MSFPLFLLSDCFFFLFCPSLLSLSYFLRKETQDNHWAKNNYRYEYSESFLQYDNVLTKDKKISWLLTCLSKGMLQRSSAGFHPEQELILPGVETGVCRREGNSFWHLTVTFVNVVIKKHFLCIKLLCFKFVWQSHEVNWLQCNKKMDLLRCHKHYN